MPSLPSLGLARPADADRHRKAHDEVRPQLRNMRVPVLWGVVLGGIQVASPVAFWWLPPATVYAIGLAFIATVYVGFAVADGRPKVVAVETVVATAFVAAAAAGVTGPAWILVAGFFAHGVKDAWQHHTGFVGTTRWWPPFCAAVDWVVALVLLVGIVAGTQLR